MSDFLTRVRTIRPDLSGVSDAELSGLLGIPYAEEPKRNAISAGLSSGLDGVQGSLYGLGGALADAAGWASGAEWMQEQADRNQMEAYSNGRPDLEKIEDQSLGSALPYMGYQFTKQVPLFAGMAASTLIPGGAPLALAARAGAVAPRVLGGGGLTAGANFAARRAALEQGANLARMTATAGALGAGEMYNESVEAGDPSPWASLALGLPYGIAEAAVPNMVLGQWKGAAKESMKDLLLSGGVLKNMARSGAKAGAGEVGTELFQNELEMSFNPNLSDEEVFSRRLNSAVAGGLVGGGLGTVGGIPQGLQRNRLVGELQQSGFVDPGKNSPTDLLKGLGYKETYDSLGGQETFSAYREAQDAYRSGLGEAAGVAEAENAAMTADVQNFRDMQDPYLGQQDYLHRQLAEQDRAREMAMPPGYGEIDPTVEVNPAVPTAADVINPDWQTTGKQKTAPKAPAAPKEKPLGKTQTEFMQLREEAIALGVDVSTLKQLDKEIADKKLGNARQLVKQIREAKAVAPTALPLTPEQRLQQGATNGAQATQTVESKPQETQTAATELSPLERARKAVASSGKQAPVALAILDYIAANPTEAIDSQGVFQYENIAKALGKKRGSIESAVKNVIRVRVPRDLIAALPTGRQVEAHALDNLGLAPNQQTSQLGVEEVMGDEGSGQQMTILNSAGATSENQFADVTGNQEGAKVVDPTTGKTANDLLAESGAMGTRGWVEPSNYQTAAEAAAEDQTRAKREAHAAMERQAAAAMPLGEEVVHKDHAGNPIKEVDIEDALAAYAQFYGGDVASLDASQRIQIAKAWIAAEDGVLNSRQFKEIMDGIRTTAQKNDGQRSSSVRAIETSGVAEAGVGADSGPETARIGETVPQPSGETQEVVQGDGRQGARSEEISVDGIETEWDKGARALGTTEWQGLTDEQRDYILGSGTWQEFDEAAGEVLDEINGITDTSPADVEGFAPKVGTGGTAGSATQPQDTRKDARVTGTEGRWYFGNESVSGSMSRIDEDSDVALDNDDLVGAVFINGVDRTRDGTSGRATNALQSVTQWADQNGETLVLSPAASRYLTQEQLKAWYARNGFEDRGDVMVRAPQKVGAGETAEYKSSVWYKALPTRHQEILDRVSSNRGGILDHIAGVVFDPSLPDGKAEYDPATDTIHYNYTGQAVTGNALEFVFDHELNHAYDLRTGASKNAALFGMDFAPDGSLIKAVGKFAQAAQRLFESGKVKDLRYPLSNLYDPDGLAPAAKRDFSQIKRSTRGRMELYAQLRAFFSNADQEEANSIKESEPELYEYLKQEAANEKAFTESEATTKPKVEAADTPDGRLGNAPSNAKVELRGLTPFRSYTEATVQERLQAIKTTAKDLGKKLLHKVVFMHDLVDIAVKEGLTKAKNFNELMGQKDQIRNRLEERVDQIMQKASQLKDKATVEKFLKDSTMDQKWGYVPDWDKTTKVDPVMKSRFNSLSAEGQQVVKEMFQYGEATYNQLRTLAAKEVNAEYDALAAKFPAKKAELEKDRAKEVRRIERTLPKLQGPYAPLKRFGDHVVVAESQAYIDAEKNGDRKRMDELESDGNHRVVEFFETAGEAEFRAKEFKAKGGFARVSAKNKQETFKHLDELPWAAVSKVKTAIENDPELGAKQALRRMVTDLYLQMLGESSARKAEMTRKNTVGAGDMFRAFASQGRNNAHFLASMDKSAEISRQITAMKNEAADENTGNPDAKNRVYNEIAKRYAQALDYRETPWADKAMRLTSIWMLLTSPAYYITNATQTYMVAMPVLGGKYGNRAFSEINKAYGDIGKLVTKMGHDFSFDDLVKGGKITAKEAEMLNTLRDSGKLDITIASDLGRWAEGSMDQGPVAKMLQKMNGAVAKVEALNRITTALAAYRLSGGSVEYAGKIVDQTQGNYAGTNAPRFFAANGAMKLVTQFRKYQLIQISLISRLLHDSFKHADPGERAAARKAFLWLFTQQAVFTGIKGLPIPAVAIMIAGALGGDDDKDWERNLRKWVGDDDTALLLTRGLPAYLGLDISGRTGMGNAFSLLPFSDVEPSKQGYKEAVFGATGAFIGGMGSQLFDGIDKMSKGQYYKGTEALVPRGLRDALAGYRMATEGITDSRGDVKLRPDEISFLAGFAKAIGMPTTTITEFNLARGDLIELSKHFTARDTSLKSKYAEAYKTNDTDAMRDARQEWMDVQEAKRRWAAEMSDRGFKDPKLVEDLKVRPLSQLLKAPQEKAKRERPWASVEVR